MFSCYFYLSFSMWIVCLVLIHAYPTLERVVSAILSLTGCESGTQFIIPQFLRGLKVEQFKYDAHIKNLVGETLAFVPRDYNMISGYIYKPTTTVKFPAMSLRLK